MVQDSDKITASLSALTMENEQCASSSSYTSPRPHPGSLPRIFAKSFILEGLRTDIWIQVFHDRSVITCSQLGSGRIGNWLLCQRRASDLFSTKKADFDISHLLGATGRDDPFNEVLAQQIMQTIVSTSTDESILTTVLFGLALHQESSRKPAVFHTLVNLLTRLYRESISDTLE